MILAVVLATLPNKIDDSALRVSAHAEASVRIVAPASGTKVEWDRTPAMRKKEAVIIDAKGEKRRLLLIEHE